MITMIRTFFIYALFWAVGTSTGLAAQSLPLDRIKLPPGFSIETYARIDGARSMAVVESLKTVFVGTRGSKVYAVLDADRDFKADRVITVLSGLKVPNGIAWKDGYLYVAEQHRIVRFKATDLSTLQRAKAEVLYANLPDDAWHGWRYTRFGPDGRLYISVGAPCNICRVKGYEGTIVRLRPTGGAPEIYASGVRNSVGFDFQPATGEMYFTDNGADNMGDDSPPDELNHAPKQGLWFGYPYFGGGSDRTPQFRGQKLPHTPTVPVIKFGAHVASLGIHFYRGGQFPAEYKNDAFVVQRGSWNRSVPDGYRLMRIRFDKKTHKAIGKEIFAQGWLNSKGNPGGNPGGNTSGDFWGRIVDVKELGDGSLLVSDNHADAVYRITYRQP